MEKCFKWRLNCSTHGTVYNYTESDLTPPKCPHDENDIITPSSETIVETLEKNTQEFKPALNQGGFRKTDIGFVFTATNSQVTVHRHNISKKIFIKSGSLTSDNNIVGDQISMELIDYNYLYKNVLYPAQVDVNGTMTNIELIYPNGVPIHKYIDDVPVRKNGETESVNEAITELDCNGLAVDVTYKSTGTQDVVCGVGIYGYS